MSQDSKEPAYQPDEIEAAELEFRSAGGSHPAESHTIARTEAKGLQNVSLCFFRAPDINLAPSDIGMGVG